MRTVTPREKLLHLVHILLQISQSDKKPKFTDVSL